MTVECPGFEVAVSAYLDKELPDVETRSLFLHLADCKQCRAFLEVARVAEAQALRGERMTASKRLDDRVASIRASDAVKIDDKRLRSDLQHSLSSDRRQGPAYRSGGVRVFRASLALRSLLAGAVGLLLGLVQPWSYISTSSSEPQIVYVSVLPSLTVLGNVNEQGKGGKLK